MPKVLAQLRQESYAAYAWPAPLAAAFRRGGLVTALAMALGAGGVFLLALLLRGPAVLFGATSLAPGRGFYDVIPYGAMVRGGSAAFLFALLALGIGFVRFWRASGGRPARCQPATAAARPARCGDAAPSRRRRLWLQRHRREFRERAAPVPSPDGLRVPAVLRRHRGRHDLSPCPRLAGAVSVRQRAGAAGHRRRAGNGRRHHRAIVAEADRRPRAAAARAAGRGRRAAAPAAADRAQRAAAAGAARHRGDGGGAGRASRPRARVLPDHAVRQVRARPVPDRRADPPCRRTAGADRTRSD